MLRRKGKAVELLIFKTVILSMTMVILDNKLCRVRALGTGIMTGLTIWDMTMLVLALPLVLVPERRLVIVMRHFLSE